MTLRIVDNHPNLTDKGVFFLEGVKPAREIDLLKDVALFQQHLTETLQYFLYQSLLGPRPHFWQEELLQAKSLSQVIKCFEESEFFGCWPLPPPGQRVKTTEFAEMLALAYGLWDEILSQVNRGPVNQGKISPGRTYEEWLRDGGSQRKYRPVHELRSLLGAKGRDDFFIRATVHGSVATLDDTPGFSDLDLAFIISASVLKSQSRLLELRELAREVLILTYAFDPFMHHGPYYLTEMDLIWYPEAMLPTVLFGYGMDLLDGAPELKVLTRPAPELTDRWLEIFTRFFEEWPAHPFILKDSYDLEWVLGNSMILPALYLQRITGEFRYKRETFPLAEKDFSPKEWEPIRSATALRTALPARFKPSRPLVWFARRLRWPQLIQRRARRHSSSLKCAREATQKLGPDYPQRVLGLLQAMNNKLAHAPSAQRESIPRVPCKNVSWERYFDDIPYGPFTGLPHKVPPERYEAACELIVGHWKSLPIAPTAIYQLGQVGMPGISDLDFILVFPERSRLDWTQFQPQTFPEWVQQLLTHPPYCCTESAWLHLPAWYPIFNLRHLWGEPLPEPKVPDKMITGCSLGMLVDYLIAKVPLDFLLIAWQRPLRLRILLSMLYSLRYTTLLAEKSGIPFDSGESNIINEISYLRKSWFESEPQERLETLARLSGQASEIAGSIILGVAKAILDNLNEIDLNSKVQNRSTTSTIFNFLTHWDFKEMMWQSFEQYSRLGVIEWGNPACFLQVLAIYADECPDLARYLAANGCQIRLLWDGGRWNEGLRYHARAMSAYGRSAASLGVPAQKYVALGYMPQAAAWKSCTRILYRILKGDLDLRYVFRKMVNRL